jgi:L-fuculose-phosphate aldolase
MSKLYTAKDLENLVKAGKDLNALPACARFSPMAMDILRKHNAKPGTVKEAATPANASGAPKIHSPVLPNYEYNWTSGADPKSAAELEAFFYSEDITALKQRICDIGQRIWNKGYVDGNGGNITVRVGDNLVLCTPTLISKGFMTVDDICMVDLDGNQVAGTRPRTSEVNTHLGIMKHEPSPG